MNRSVVAWVILLVVLAAGGCVSRSDDRADTAPSPARTAAAVPQQTLVVTSVVGAGPRSRAPSSAALWPSRPCKAWNVSSGSYGLSVVTEHVLVGPQDGARMLAAVRGLPAVRSAVLAGAQDFDRVPAPERGFTLSRELTCPG